jgi:hypothetical protein
MKERNICKCCNQEVIVTRSFDDAHAESLVVWDNDAKDIAEEYLYECGNEPELNSWESLKVYKFLDENIKSQIKRFYEMH